MISSFRLKRAASLAVAICLFGFLSHARAAFTEQGATILGGANFSSRSASLADIDNDGDLDAMFQHQSGASLYRNNFYSTGTPSFTFTSITNSMLPTSSADRPDAAWSAAWGDYNSDGLIDVFVGQANGGVDGQGNPMRGDILKNNGPTTRFSNVGAAIGLNDAGFHQNVAWADMNNDHRLDLVIGMEGPEKHEVYLQGATGNFTPVGAAAGFQVAFGTKAYGMAIGDTDGDGDLDVYISTCASGNIRNNFFRNNLVETGTLTFTDIADSNGTQDMNNTYGSEFVDFDNDRDLDLLMTGADGNRTRIFRNDGSNQFTDVESVPGVSQLFETNGMDRNGAKPVDYDNDGDLDLYFHDNQSSNVNHVLYRNDGNWKFTNVTNAMGLNVAFNLETVSGVPTLVSRPVGAGAYDSTWGDLDLDGDQDLIDPNTSSSNGFSSPERVYINDASTNGNKWLYVELDGPSWNTTGLGSSLFATINSDTPQEVTLRREANTNPNTFNQSDLPVHFGLGATSLIDELLVQWPDGTKQVLTNVAANQYLTIEYMPGDYSGDGAVDSSDYLLWRKGMGTSFNTNDYNVWRSHYGQSLGGGAAGVPEPATAVLMFVALGGFVARRVRR